MRKTNQSIMSNDDDETQHHSWSTWEELLLACAVKRHGFHNWSSVAMEVQTRSSIPNLCITAENCRQKYYDLRCRFTAKEDEETDDSLPWLEDLRKIRVAELRQEVHRYDVSILSLQSKVTRLENEREESLKLNDNSQEKPDLEDFVDERSETDKNDGGRESVKPETENLTGKSVSGENRSVNGSNSTAPKGENQETGEEDAERERKPIDTGADIPDPVSNHTKPAVEDSCNGSSEPNRTRKGDESNELRDSVTHSKESSDVQSSASLTRKRKRRRRREITGGVSSGGDEPPEIGEVTHNITRIPVKSQPLMEVLENIRSHKNGSLFEGRLKSQESEEYKNTVKQHMDLETVQSKLENGTYSSCSFTFYRDLLLVFHNAIVFFSKSSIESTTAFELRNLISIQIHKQTQLSVPSPEQTSSPPVPEQPKSDSSLLAKHKSSVPILVCRKRSSISSKSQVKVEEKVEEENVVDKEDLVKKIITGSRSLRRSNKKPDASVTSNSAEKVMVTPKSDKKKVEVIPADKKRSAADFLRRIKRNSPVEPAKNSKVEVKKKGSNGKGDSNKGKERVLRQSGGGRAAAAAVVKDEGSPSKRNVGRPPKKGPEVVGVKRGRDGGGKEVAASKPAKKRTRR